MSSCLHIIEKKINFSENNIISEYYNDLKKYNTNDSYQGKNALFFGGHFLQDSDQLNFLRERGLGEYDVLSLKKALKSGILFSVKDVKCTRTDNSFAKLNNNTYIRIVNFVINKHTKEEMLLYYKIKSKIEDVLSKNNSTVQRIIEENVKLEITSVENLTNICVVTEVYGTMYLSELANSILCNN